MLFEPLFSHAAAQPAEVAVIGDRGFHTYQQVAAMAAELGLCIGSQTGQPRVGLLLPPGAGFVATFYGVLLAGKTVVPINYLLGDGEIAHCVRDSGIDAVVTVPTLAGRLRGMPLNVMDLAQLACPPELPLTAGPPPARMHSPAAADVAVLLYTSGTSGLPKGVPLTYGNLQSNVDAAIAHADFESRHKFLGLIPLFHVFGMVATMLAPVQLGATVVYISRFSPLGAVNAIRQHHVSLVLGVPSMYAAILRLKDVAAEDFRTVHAMFSGGEPLPAALREAFRVRFGVTLLEAYGMTETSLAVSLNTPQSHRAGSVGKPVPGIRIKIADDAGEALPAGAEGEIWVRGPMVMERYHNLPAETAAAVTPDGYFRTGDLGSVDADGFLYITGRKKDVIIVAGEKVSPREIEEVLAAHPAVAEVAVVGRKDSRRGEVVAAFIVPREGQPAAPEELREFCRRQGLAQWKVPREVRVVLHLPRSATGKVLKQLLAEQAMPTTGR